jgi:hypothetical protein
LIKFEERGSGYLAECDFALGYGLSRHEALDDMIVALGEFTKKATPQDSIKATKLIAEAKRLVADMDP